MSLLVLLAVYDAIILSTVVDNVAEWVRTAPAWQGYGGEVDNSGRLVHQFGSHSSGKFTIRCDLDTNRATIRGAVQPFHQGHNSGPFPYSEALAACEAIVTALQVPASSLRVHALETGVTVPTSEAPTTFLAQLARASYGPTQRPFYAKEPPAGIRAPLQYTAVFEQYRAKIYDKGTYNRLMQKPLPPGGNGFRYELHYRKARKIAAALGWQGNLTLANLMQQDVFAHLASALLKSWQQIHLPLTMDLQGLNIDERALLIAGSEPGFWEGVKQQTPPATYKRKRALFHRLQKQQEAPQAATPHTVAVRQELTAALPPGHQI